MGSRVSLFVVIDACGAGGARRLRSPFSFECATA